MEPEVGEAAAVFHDRGHLEFGCVVHHAAQFGLVDGGGIVMHYADGTNQVCVILISRYESCCGREGIAGVATLPVSNSHLGRSTVVKWQLLLNCWPF